MSDSRAVRIAIFHRPLTAMWSTSGSFPQKNFPVFLQKSKCHLYFFSFKIFSLWTCTLACDWKMDLRDVYFEVDKSVMYEMEIWDSSSPAGESCSHHFVKSFLTKTMKNPPEKFLFFVLKSHGENSGKSCQNPGSVGGIEMEH